MLLGALVLVLCLQPFLCMLHCDVVDVPRRQGAAHTFQVLCSTPGSHGDVIVAASEAASAMSGSAASIPAYYPGVLAATTLLFAALAVVARIGAAPLPQPAAFSTVPVPPPPR